jgi:hypothetical protein
MTARKKSVAEMARDKGIKPSLVYNRINRGWTLTKALNTPVNVKNRPYKAKAKFVEEYTSKPAANDPQWYASGTQKDVRPVIYSILGAIGVIVVAWLLDN